MNILQILYAGVSIVLICTGIFVDVFSFWCNAKKLISPTSRISGIPVLAFILYMLAASCIEHFDGLYNIENKSIVQITAVVLVTFHIITHVLLPLIGKCLVRVRKSKD